MMDSLKMEKEMQKLPADMRAKLMGLAAPEKIGAVRDQLVAEEQKKTTIAQNRVDAASTIRDKEGKHHNTESGITEFVKGWGGISSTWNWAMTGGLTGSEDANIRGHTKEELEQDKKDITLVTERMVTNAATKDPSKLMGVDMGGFLEDFGSTDTSDSKALLDVLDKHDLGLSENQRHL